MSKEKAIGILRDHAGKGAALCLIVFAFLFPVLINDEYLTRIGVLILLYYLCAVGYNALLNHAGQFDLALGAYFAIAAYISALLDIHTGWSFWGILPVAVFCSVLIAILLGSMALRFSGDYLAIVTLAFSEITRLVIINWTAVTRGPMGLPGISDISIFSYVFNLTDYYYLYLTLAILAAFLYRRLSFSGVGLAWASISENSVAASATGNNVALYRLSSIVFCSLLVGIAGAIYPHFLNFLDPSVAGLDFVFSLCIMVVLGGGNLLGLFISVIIFTAIPEIFRGFLVYRVLILGIILILIMNIRPQGLQFGRSFRLRIPFSLRKRKKESSGRDKDTAYRDNTDSELKRPEKSSSPETIFSMTHVSKAFGGLQALQNVDLQIYKNEILSLIGPNGAGKTTLFNIASGILRANEGNIEFRNIAIGNLPPFRISRLGMARTFQNLNLMDNLTVFENVMISMIPKHFSKSKGHKHYKEKSCLRFIEFVGLSGSEEFLAKNLPYGDKRRLELARALATEPSLLLVDEPTAGMNQVEVENFIELLKQTRERGITIFCIEHNMEVAMGISDRVVVLNFGMKIAEGRPAEIMEDKKVIEAYLGRQKC